MYILVSCRTGGKISTEAINLPLPHIQGLMCTQTVSDPGLYLHFHQYSGILAVKVKAPPQLNTGSFCIAKYSNTEARSATPPVRGTRTFYVWFTVLRHFKSDVSTLLLNKVMINKSCCLFNNNLQHHHHLSNVVLHIRQ